MKIGTLYLIIINALFPFLIGCGEGAKGQQRTEITDPMNAYRSQEHRFEIRGCQLFYNEQHVVLDSLHNFEKIFGNNYNTEGYKQKYFTDKPIEFYIKACKVSEGEYRPCIERLSILMSHKEKYDLNYSWDSVNSLMPSLEGYILYDGVLVDEDTRIEDLNEQLKAKGKHMLSTALSTHNQGIAYECGGCSPGPNCTGLTYISLFYNESSTGGLGKIKALRYFYEH